MRLVTLAYFFIIYAVLQVLFLGYNAGGEAAHLGGAAMGCAADAQDGLAGADRVDGEAGAAVLK